MREPEITAQMGELHNLIIALIDQSECNIFEIITILRLVTSRLEKSFELSVMGNPMASITESVKDGDNLEKTSL